MGEKVIENYLVKQVQKLGGLTRKLQWVERRGAPDRLVVFKGRVYFVELKTAKGRLTPHQVQEHCHLTEAGASVVVIRSKAETDEFLKILICA